ILDMHPAIYAIVFCRTRAETKELAEKLSTEGYNADALHGDLSQEQREYTMARFRNRSLQLLIATDVAARGLDVNDLTHVINYNLPDDPDVYIHRSGRTGRAHRKGVSISIIHSREHYRLRDLERRVSKPFEKKRIPTGPEICERQLFHLVDKVENVEVDEVQIEPYLPAIYSKLAWLDRDELIKRFMSMEFNRFLAYYRDARDINIGSPGSGKSAGREPWKKENRDEGKPSGRDAWKKKGDRDEGKPSGRDAWKKKGERDEGKPGVVGEKKAWGAERRLEEGKAKEEEAAYQPASRRKEVR